MQIINNTINQTIYFADDRGEAEQPNPVNAAFTHLATEWEAQSDLVDFDATGWRNGLYTCTVTDAVTLIKITSFIVKVIDIIDLTLTENTEVKDIGYVKNR